MYEIRDVTESDIPELLPIRNARGQLLGYLKQSDGKNIRFLAYTEDNRILAFAKLYLKAPKGSSNKLQYPKISDLQVHRNFRSKGIGTRFINWMESIVIKQGYEHIYLNVDPVENTRAMKLYENLGYKPLQHEPEQKTVPWYDETGKMTECLIYELPMSKRL
jgi:GNAT superfamily N-acetyltransferase